MFTGIVEEKGTIRELRLNGSSGKIRIACRKVLEDTKKGDSIAVNGICLTVTELYEDAFTADVMAETVRRSSLSEAGLNDPVNLERAMAMNGRFGGHIVSGHIDGTGHIREIKKEENAVWFTIEAPQRILRYVIEKGSIAIDGISLTVAYVDEHVFKVSVIPHTIRETTLAAKKPGDKVNLENDVLAKYVAKFLRTERSFTGSEDSADQDIEPSVMKSPDEGGITMEFLERYGF